MFHTRAIDFFTKLPIPGMRRMLSNCSSQLFKRFPKLYILLMLPLFPLFQKVSTFFEDAPYSGCKTMRLKTDLNIKSPPWGLVLMLSVSNMQIYKGESQETVLPSYDTNEPQQWSALQHNLRLQEWYAYLGFNPQLLIGLKTSTRGKSHLVLET